MFEFVVAVQVDDCGAVVIEIITKHRHLLWHHQLCPRPMSSQCSDTCC